MSERDKVKQKIVALLNKTTDAGATEHEALNAAKKAAELMEHYDIETTELDIKNSTAVKKEVVAKKFGRGNIGAGFTVNLAKLFDCKVWGSCNTQYAFFGFPEDVEVVTYLFEVLSKTVLSELDIYRNSEEYDDLRNVGYHGKTLTASFHKGIESRISQRLLELARDKKENVQAKTGTALVLLKEQQVEDDFEDLGIKLRTVTRNTRVGSSSAYSSGQARGSRVNINTGIGSGSGQRRLG